MWQGQTICPFSTLVTAQPWWVHVALNALNWPADGCVTTKSACALMTPPPTGTSAVLTGVPLGAAPLDDPDVVSEAVAVDEPDAVDDVADAVVVLDAAPPVVGGVLEPPHAARAAAPATPAPPTPAARSTVRRRTAVAFAPAEASDVRGDPDVVLSGCSDITASCLAGWSVASNSGLAQGPRLVAGSTNRESPMVPTAAVNHLW
jgi:hypothetical protein